MKGLHERCFCNVSSISRLICKIRFALSGTTPPRPRWRVQDTRHVPPTLPPHTRIPSSGIDLYQASQTSPRQFEKIDRGISTQPFRIREGVLYECAHIRLSQLSDHRSILELHHRMDDRLGMLTPQYRRINPKQPFGLDHLKPC